MGMDPPLLSLRRKRRVVVLPEVEMEDESRAWAGSTTTWREEVAYEGIIT